MVSKNHLQLQIVIIYFYDPSKSCANYIVTYNLFGMARFLLAYARNMPDRKVKLVRDLQGHELNLTNPDGILLA